MLSEEKKAIEDLKDFKSIRILYGNRFTMFLEQLKKYQEATDTVLNLIEKLQKENEELKSDNLEKARVLETFDNRKYRKRYLKERRKEEPNLLYPDGDEIYKRYYELKKQIDLMAEQLAGLTIWDNEKEEPLILTDKDEVKQYFEKLAKEKGE